MATSSTAMLFPGCISQQRPCFIRFRVSFRPSDFSANMSQDYFMMNLKVTRELASRSSACGLSQIQVTWEQWGFYWWCNAHPLILLKDLLVLNVIGVGSLVVSVDGTVLIAYPKIFIIIFVF